MGHYPIILHLFTFQQKQKKSRLLSCRWDDWGGNRLLTAIWVQSISLRRVFPLCSPREKKAFVTEKKWLQWRFCDWFQFPVWKLVCFGVDNLIMICACVCLWPIPVVLLDTTSVLGELGWKAYPINGVRTSTFDFSFSFHFIHGNVIKTMHGQCHIRGLSLIRGWAISSLFWFAPLFPGEKCCNLETDNELWSLRKLQLCRPIAPSQFSSCSHRPELTEKW